MLADCDPEARVPGCPDWTAADLLWHLAGVQRFWATIIDRGDRPGPDDLEEPTARPRRTTGCSRPSTSYSAALVAALEAADPAEPAWTWSAEQTVGFTFRRQAHEALIHRLDAEQTAGQVTPLDPALAADGVDECLDVMFGGAPPWGAFAPLPHYVRVDITDRDESLGAARPVHRHRPRRRRTTTWRTSAWSPRRVPRPTPSSRGRRPALDAWLWRAGTTARSG